MNEAHAIHLRRLYKEPVRSIIRIRNSEYEIPYARSISLELRIFCQARACYEGTSRSTAFYRITRFVLYGTPLLRIQIMLMGNLRAIYKQLHPLAY